MASRSVLFAVTIAVLSSAGAVACYLRAVELRTEARWLMERGVAEATEYTQTFEGAAQDKQFATLEQRREVLERATIWQRGQLLLVLLTVIAAFSSYVLYLFHKLRSGLEEVDAPIPGYDERGNPHGPATAAAHVPLR